MTRTLLLLHGFTGSRESWAEHLAAFSELADVLAVDLPGHGANPRPASVEETADGLAERLGDRAADVLGYSLGARVALRLAIAHPGRVGRLLLESPSAGIAGAGEREARRRADDELAAGIERNGLEAFVGRWERQPVLAGQAALGPEAAARQRAIRLAGDPQGLAGSLRLAGQGAMEPLHGRLSEVRAPTLVIAGALDPARPRAELVAAGIPGARLALVDGAGHTPHLERPEAFRRIVTDFLMEGRAP